jgi:putative transport protein
MCLVGARRHGERVAARLGSVAWPSIATDMAVLGLAIAIGGLIGLPALHFGGVDIGLSAPVGVLIGGLVVGWLHSRRPIVGRVPDAALSLLNRWGLAVFWRWLESAQDQCSSWVCERPAFHSLSRAS